jgi:hypothetical protein
MTKKRAKTWIGFVMVVGVAAYAHPARAEDAAAAIPESAPAASSSDSATPVEPATTSESAASSEPAEPSAAEVAAEPPSHPAHPVPVVRPRMTSSQSTPKKRKARVEQDAEGTEALGRFKADTVIKSQYRLNGEQLEVDPD